MGRNTDGGKNIFIPQESKFADFEKYCKICKYSEKRNEMLWPCYICVSRSANGIDKKPYKFKK